MKSYSNVSGCSRKRMPVPDSCTSHSTRMTPRNSQGAGLHGPIHCLENCCGKHSMRNPIYWNTNHLINQCKQKIMRRITKFSLLLSLVLGLYWVARPRPARICMPAGRSCPTRRWRSVFSLSLGYRFKMSDGSGRWNPALRQVCCCPGIFSGRIDAGGG